MLADAVSLMASLLESEAEQAQISALVSCPFVSHILQQRLAFCAGTMRFGSTAKVLLNCKLKYYRISKCAGGDTGQDPQRAPLSPFQIAACPSQ